MKTDEITPVHDKCNCFLGFSNQDKIYKNNITYMVKMIANVQSIFHEWRNGSDSKLTPKEILDSKKGYISKFNFCPECGEKINWKEISNKFE